MFFRSHCHSLSAERIDRVKETNDSEKNVNGNVGCNVKIKTDRGDLDIRRAFVWPSSVVLSSKRVPVTRSWPCLCVAPPFETA